MAEQQAKPSQEQLPPSSPQMQIFLELFKLVENLGWDRAFMHIKAGNKPKNKISDILIYEHIIKTVLDTFQCPEEKFYKKGGKIDAPDARRTAYFLIEKHLSYSHEFIASQFKVDRTSVTKSLSELDKYKAEYKLDNRFYKDYMTKHERVEQKVIEFIDGINKEEKKQAEKLSAEKPGVKNKPAKK